MTYIDSHVHFWDQRTLPYPWLGEVPAIAGPHTPEDLQREAAPDLPAQIVFVECGAPWLDEVKWIEQLAAREPRITGMVAKVVMDTGPVTTAAIAEPPVASIGSSTRHRSTSAAGGSLL